ncbi:hypothetical protein NA56DRAFT_699745 [Hyaloscypha hepaticicola]|uniref:Uncharacterized protein n=1 Tax=Hyaloscypha hepaticicola TaxID=2082293 RepID=A0A2J6QFA8_9HELO|nr:hypothetical protein NA56DRAFT_699745 [Hyaloscypha hepaticicola]
MIESENDESIAGTGRYPAKVSKTPLQITFGLNFRFGELLDLYRKHRSPAIFNLLHGEMVVKAVPDGSTKMLQGLGEAVLRTSHSDHENANVYPKM